MIRTVMLISCRRLWHNKPELLLTFVVPLIFFSIFAWIFGSKNSRVDARQLKVVVCDEVGNDWSQAVIAQLRQSDRLVLQSATRQGARVNLNRNDAEKFVRRGHVSAAIVLTRSDSQSVAASTASVNDSVYRIHILNDSFDQLASQIVPPLVQKSVVSMVSSSIGTPTVSELATVRSAEYVGIGSTVASLPTTTLVPAMATSVAATSTATPLAHSAAISMPTIEVVDVLGRGKTNPVIAMYAAGIAVMFLLFSATTGSGSLLEEKENSTLERILCSRATMDHLLLGKWCYLTLIGCLQTTLMFTWGAVAFGLNLREHLDGFAIMTLVTSGAAASFALMLAAACRSRTQLGWVSTILILSMSALGGSMVPRYLMGEEIKRVGQLTFNAWALDGYNKVFWRELPLAELSLELTVLASCGLVFLVLARICAMRWERV
ncbi:MAG: ABC transporter permease [Pirellulaceae bacterium]|nr:ABC transporter permease [Pirellulaceae bacterium]